MLCCKSSFNSSVSITLSSSELIKMRTRAVLGFLTNHPDYQLSSREWLVFLTIAMEEGVTAPELAETLQLPQQTLSRKIRSLGQTVDDSGKFQGYNLIRIVPKGKAHSLFLTDEGRALWQAFGEMHSKVDQLIIDQFKDGEAFSY
jgi:DNA-binding MarR family transcriptional regulator